MRPGFGPLRGVSLDRDIGGRNAERSCDLDRSRKGKAMLTYTDPHFNRRQRDLRAPRLGQKWDDGFATWAELSAAYAAILLGAGELNWPPEDYYFGA